MISDFPWLIPADCATAIDKRNSTRPFITNFETTICCTSALPGYPLSFSPACVVGHLANAAAPGLRPFARLALKAHLQLCQAVHRLWARSRLSAMMVRLGELTLCRLSHRATHRPGSHVQVHGLCFLLDTLPCPRRAAEYSRYCPKLSRP